MGFRIVLAALCVVSLSGAAFAHEFIAKPDTTQVRKGDSLRVEAQASHIFMASEEAEDPDSVRLELWQGDVKAPVALAEDKTAHSLAGHVTVPGDGPAMLVGYRLPQIWSDTTEGVLEGDRKLLEAQGKKVLKVGRYEKFAKTVLNPASNSDVYKQNVGQTLEVLLLTNPADISGKGDIKVQVLHNGKPVQTSVGLSHDGYSKEEDTYLESRDTDAQGMVTFHITKPALWMVRAALTAPVKDTPGVDKENLRAVYVFPVK